MKFQVLSKVGRDFQDINDYTDKALALAMMQIEGEKGEADNWELTPVGQGFHWECTWNKVEKEVWTKRVPPINR